MIAAPLINFFVNVEFEELRRYIGANIRQSRLRNDMTQEQLANAADIDISFLQRLERGAVNISVKVLLQVANALDVPITALFKPRKMPERAPGRPKEASRRR